jgi:hypothetical protein
MDTSSSEFGIFVSGEVIVKSERMPAQSSLLPHATTIRLRSQVAWTYSMVASRPTRMGTPRRPHRKPTSSTLSLSVTHLLLIRLRKRAEACDFPLSGRTFEPSGALGRLTGPKTSIRRH